jgi:peptide/nickel transport system substrate-binding protein
MTARADRPGPGPMLTRRRLLAATGMAALAPFAGRAQTPVPLPNLPLVRVAVSRLPEPGPPGSSALLDHLWLDTLCLDSPMRWGEGGLTLAGLAFWSSTSVTDEALDLVVRPGAMFPDGTPVHADDLRYTLERVRNRPEAAPHTWRLEHVFRIETIDTQTVRLMLDRPDASLSSSLAHQAFGVVRAGTDGAGLQQGSGPFTLRSASEDRLIYDRNPLFWQLGRPRIDRLDVTAITEDSPRSTAMARGEIQVMPNAPLLDIPMLREEPTVYLAGGPSTRVCHLQVNLDAPGFADARVRLLLSRAIDRARLVDVATAGQATPTSRLFPQGSWAFADLPEQEPLSAETVREELRLLGIPTDLRVRLLTDNADATLANTAIVLQEQLASCGIALSVDLLEGDELEEATLSRDYDLLAGYTEPWRDPHELVRPLLASDGTKNRSGYASEQVDILIRGAIYRDDLAFRIERYALIEEAVERDAPVIVLFNPDYYDAVSVDLAGYRALPPVTSRGLLSISPGEP